MSYDLNKWNKSARVDGAFSERRMLENVVYRSEDAPVLTMYLHGSNG